MPCCQAEGRKWEERGEVCALLSVSGKTDSFRLPREVRAAIPALNLQQRSVSEISRSCGCKAGPREITRGTDGKVVSRISDLWACGSGSHP